MAMTEYFREIVLVRTPEMDLALQQLIESINQWSVPGERNETGFQYYIYSRPDGGGGASREDDGAPAPYTSRWPWISQLMERVNSAVPADNSIAESISINLVRTATLSYTDRAGQTTRIHLFPDYPAAEAVGHESDFELDTIEYGDRVVPDGVVRVMDPRVRHEAGAGGGAVVAYDNDCPICLSSEIKSPDSRFILLETCGHRYHVECLAEYAQWKNCCAVCRFEFIRDPPTPQPSPQPPQLQVQDEDDDEISRLG